jgi:hypothetical protein
MTDFHPNSPHDHFFRRTFDVAKHTHALLMHRLPAQVLNRIRPGSLQRAKETFLAQMNMKSGLICSILLCSTTTPRC